MKHLFRVFSLAIVIVLVVSLVEFSGTSAKMTNPQVDASSFQFVPLALPTGLAEGDLSAIWGSDSKDIYVVGAGYTANGNNTPLVYHYDGTAWKEASPLTPDGMVQAALSGVWGFGANNVYAVGTAMNANWNIVPVVYHNNGAGWTPSILPLATGLVDGYLSGDVWGSGPEDIHAVGYAFHEAGYPVPLLYHYNGSTWVQTPLSLPDGRNSGYFYGVWGSSANDAYVAGISFDTSWNNFPLLYHYDGSIWADVSPALPDGWLRGSLSEGWSSSANDVYAVGFGYITGDNSLPLLYHNTGASWVPGSPSLPAGRTAGMLSAVWGGSNADVYAAGASYTGGGNWVSLLYHNDGAGWTEASPVLPAGWTDSYLVGGWTFSTGDVYTVGYGYQGNIIMPLLYHKAGSLDVTSPTVVSIVRASASPTSAASVDFTVTFSEAVSGVNVNDFALKITGKIGGAAVSSVTGSGDIYTVTVNTGTGKGKLRLDVPVSATITDISGNPLAGLPFTGSQTYRKIQLRTR